MLTSLDSVCIKAAEQVGVQYDANLTKTFAGVAPKLVRALHEALESLGAFVPLSLAEMYSLALGPRYERQSADEIDTRPVLQSPTPRLCSGKQFGDRVQQYEVASPEGPRPDSDYWSCTGQAAYISDGSVPNNIGLDRIQTFAYYSHAYAIAPRFEPVNQPRRTEHFASTYWATPTVVRKFGRVTSAVRNYGMLSNEALVIFDENFLATAGTQTSRGGAIPFDWPLPGLQFPANKKATALALSTSNEIALVCIQDSDTGKGQLAVVALEGRCIPFHTFPWIALPNQGSWSDFKLLGYVDLPFALPDTVAAASNGLWMGPSATGNKTLGQINIKDPGTRWGLEQGEIGWQGVIAKGGYALVSSKAENKVAVVDLSPVFKYLRHAWLDYNQQPITIAARAAGTWPVLLEEINLPKVIRTFDAEKPSSLLAGQRIDRWSTDRHKAYIGTESGMIHIVDTSSLMARWSWEKRGLIEIIGKVQVGRNPTSMCFARFHPAGLPIKAPDTLNNVLHICCRGDRRIDSIVTVNGQATIYQTISCSLMDDPVCVSTADRGNIVTVADYAGKKLLSFRIGPLWDRLTNIKWGCGPSGNDLWELAGTLDLPGYAFWCGSSNLN